MTRSRFMAAIVLAGLLAGPMQACTSTSTSESTGEYIDDATISTKVRGELIGDKDLNLFKIDVTTYKGVVQLSGFVDSETIKQRAGRVAANVSGVRSVRNDLIVK